MGSGGEPLPFSHMVNTLCINYDPCYQKICINYDPCYYQKCLFVCFSDAPLDIRIKSNLVADLLSLTGTENPFMLCSPISVLHCQKAHKCSTVERTAMLVWWTPVHFFFFAISMCRYCCPRSLHREDPRAGKSHSTAIKNRKKSSTAIQVLYNHYFFFLHLSLSSPSISPSPLREGPLVGG